MATIERMATYAAPGQHDSPVELKSRYDNFIGGHWVPPVHGEYADNLTPATGEPFTEVPRSTAEDVELALDAAHAAKTGWGEMSTTERSKVLNRIADAIEEHVEMLAVAESWENGKPVRETLAADIPLAADHFRYFASVIRGEEGAISEIDKNTMAYHFREPLGVVGQIIPFNFPILMAAWKLAPALAAGDSNIRLPRLPGAVDHAAHHRHPYRPLHTLKALRHPLRQPHNIHLGPAAGGAAYHGGAMLPQPQRLQYLVAGDNLFAGMGG